MKLREKVETNTLKVFEDNEKYELDALSQIENKLKAAFALSILIRESEKTLESLNLDGITQDMKGKLQERYDKAHAECEKYKAFLEFDAQTMISLAENDNSLQRDLDDIRDSIGKFEAKLTSIAKQIRALPIADVVSRNAGKK